MTTLEGMESKAAMVQSSKINIFTVRMGASSPAPYTHGSSYSVKVAVATWKRLCIRQDPFFV